MSNHVVIPINGKRDTVVRPPIAVPVAPSGPNPAIGIVFPICFICGLLFLLAGTIAIALIPVYLSNGHTAPRNTATSTTPPNTNPNLLFYAITNQNRLLAINAQNPSIILLSAPLTGLNAGDFVTNIDFRPAMGTLYGTSNNQLYVINETTAAARPIGSPLSATTFGNILSMEFNPVTDLLRVITDIGGNIDVNPETGEVLAINSNNTERGISVAFNNNLAGASTSTLFIINPTTNALFRQTPPSDLNGVQVGSGLGIKINSGIGFDIAPNGLALACVSVGNTLPLYLVDVNSGTFSKKLGVISQPIVTLAIPTAPVAYAITAGDSKLLIINSVGSGLQFVSKTIRGLNNGETIESLDIRPSTGRLYGISNNNRLFIVDPGKGGTKLVGTIPSTSGANYFIEVDPVADTIRAISNAGDNLRVDPKTGAVTTDTKLNPSQPLIESFAYSNNYFGATTTVLYDIASNLNQLFIQTPPNAGTLSLVGSLGVTTNTVGGFDIGGKTGIGFAVLTVGGVTSVYRIDLNSGTAISVPNTVYPVSVVAYTVGLNV